MTQNQIAYQTNLIRANELAEQVRANKAREAETHRANVAQELERIRSNQMNERLTDAANQAQYGLIDYDSLTGSGQSDFTRALRSPGDVLRNFLGPITDAFSFKFKL